MALDNRLVSPYLRRPLRRLEEVLAQRGGQPSSPVPAGSGAPAGADDQIPQPGCREAVPKPRF